MPDLSIANRAVIKLISEQCGLDLPLSIKRPIGNCSRRGTLDDTLLRKAETRAMKDSSCHTSFKLPPQTGTYDPTALETPLL
jgi:hypothetical protein